jgi:SAM-dependent methyltransferase
VIVLWPVVLVTSAMLRTDNRAMNDHSELISFYEEAYSQDPSSAPKYASWRSLGAIGKADHVRTLCARVGLAPQSTLEVGCGDGAVLCELHKHGFGGLLHGVEISAAAVRIAATRPQIDSVTLYDGVRLLAGDGQYELGVLSHVLEHVLDPAGLLQEVARACRSVVVEVPLEDNLSARRHSKREHAREIGHLRRLSRDRILAIVDDAGLRIAAELDDPLPLEVHRFFADTALQRAGASAKWALRGAIHRSSPAFARRLFSLHYACLCLPER